MQDVSGEAFGVHPSQNAFSTFNVTIDQRKMFLAVFGVVVVIEIELASVGG
jgi:hypothetical protein